MDGSYTGKDNAIDIVWLNREDHDYSSTKLKTAIYNEVREHIFYHGVNYD